MPDFVSVKNPWHGTGLWILQWMFTLIHKFSISEWFHCNRTGQWTKPVRQNHLRHWNLCSGVVAELWLGTKRAGHVEFAVALPSTSNIVMFFVLKILNLGPWQNPRNVPFLCVLWDPCHGLLRRALGRERTEFGGDKFCGDSFRSDKCCGLTLTVTKTSLSTPFSS